MLLKVYNGALIEDRERTFLTAAVTAGGSSTTLTVASSDLAPAGTSSDVWADNDYMLIGNFGEDTTEIMQVNAAVSSATAIVVDREGSAFGCRFDHPIGTPIYRLDFNRVEFSRNSTDSTSGVSVLATNRIQPDDLFTRYEDVTNSTGYGFVRFNNQTTGTFSSYSDGVNYEESGQGSSRDPRTLFMLRRKVRRLLDELDDRKLTDKMIDDALNDGQRDIAHQTFWSFYEVERSFSSVANQFAYDIPSTVQKIHNVVFDTQPLIMKNWSWWKLAHWDTDQTSADPTHAVIFNNQMLVWPRPTSSASTTTLGAAISSTTATTITVAATSSFNRGDYYRFIVDSEVIYATGSTSTTFTGCLRGQEGTTAATHSDGATVTERDIVYSGHVEPTDILETQARTSIPEPDVLALRASIDLAPLVNKSELLTSLESRFERGLKELKEKYALKQTSQFGRVKDAREVIGDTLLPFVDPNQFPKSIG